MGLGLGLGLRLRLGLGLGLGLGFGYLLTSSTAPECGSAKSYAHAVTLCRLAVWKTRSATKTPGKKKWYCSESCMPG